MPMSALGAKLRRDLLSSKAQVVTIALVIAAGVSSYVTLQSTWDSLVATRDRYYQQFRFADVFASLKRAPESLSEQLESVPGVAMVETRVVERVRIPLGTARDALYGRVVSLPEFGEPRLNQLFVQRGRLPEPGRTDEVVVLEKAASENGIAVGDPLPTILNGTLRRLTVVGIASSPEFVYPLDASNQMGVDDARFAILWMRRDVLAAAYQFGGAFNDVVFRLQRGANTKSVVDQVERITRPYGGVSVVPRELQSSNYFLEGEMRQLSGMATVVPVIFLGVAAFVLHVVLGRLIGLQRPEIAALKALGYSGFQVVRHYLGFAWAIGVLGVMFGMGIGAWLGSAMTALYSGFFRFPFLSYDVHAGTLLLAVLVGLLASSTGAALSLVQVLKLPPAEALKPAAPGRFGKSWLEKVGMGAYLSPTVKMVLREITRRPLRTIISALAVAMSVAILVVGRYNVDAVAHLLDVQFNRAWREDAVVDLTVANQPLAFSQVGRLEGVLGVEGLRSLPVRMRVGHRHRDGALIAYPDEGDLRQVVDVEGKVFEVPESGVLVTRKLAEILALDVGGQLRLETLDEHRVALDVRVVGLVDEMVGLQIHMSARELSRLLGEELKASSLLLRLDEAHRSDVMRKINTYPQVLSVTSAQDSLDKMSEQMDQTVVVMTGILTLFAAVIAVGVVYNNARVTLSVRNRDLASLRVLGMTRGEISTILLGELVVQVLLALPLGLYFGQLMVQGLSGMVDPERYRLPVVTSVQTYTFAVVVIAAAALVSAGLVRRRLNRLDLIGVLKMR